MFEMFIQQQMQAPTPAAAWFTSASDTTRAEKPAPRHGVQHTQFIQLQDVHLPSGETSRYTAAPSGGYVAPGASAAATHTRVSHASSGSTAGTTDQTELERLAEHRLLLLAAKYAAKTGPADDWQREALARLKILNDRLAVRSPLVSKEQVAALEATAQRIDERAARRAARNKELGIG